MSIKLIQERLSSYDCKSEMEEEHAIREITQEVALAAVVDHQMLFQLVPVGLVQVLQHGVLPELQADDVSLGMKGQLGHRGRAAFFGILTAVNGANRSGRS